MSVRIVTVSPADPREDRLEPAVDALRSGGVVAVPTETFYGLAADSRSAEAVARLNGLKRKASDSPVLLLAADLGQARGLASRLPEGFETLASTFWPGPLTLVVPAAESVLPEIGGGRGTVAVRVPGLTLPRRLAARLGRPITGASANLHAVAPVRTAAEVYAIFDDRLDVILDGGPTPGGAPSTLVDLASSPPRVLRTGAVPLSALRPFLPHLLEVSQR